MGATYASLRLTNLFTQDAVSVRALVDTGSSYLILTTEVARLLGYDLEECTVRPVSLADDRRIPVPVVGPLQIDFEDRQCRLEAVVLPGMECLLGFIPLEAMDLVVDPLNERLVGAHPGGQLIRA